MKKPVTALGICMGASTVSLVRIQAEAMDPGDPDRYARPEVLWHAVYPHDGDPKRALSNALQGLEWDKIDKVVATGRKFRDILNFSSIAEPEAVEHAYATSNLPGLPGDDFGRRRNLHGLRPRSRGPNRQCPDRQQMRSRNGRVFPAAVPAHGCLPANRRPVGRRTDPYHVSGRCSVFCKSDCTHATNKGIPKSRVTAGLGKMMANKILELLKKVERSNLMLVGGTARNQMMVRYLRQAIPGLIIPEEAPISKRWGRLCGRCGTNRAPFPAWTVCSCAATSL